MSSVFTILRADVTSANEVAKMVGELLTEIMATINIQAFNFNLDDTTIKLKDFIHREKYFVFVLYEDMLPIGFIALYECFALYAEGSFGTIPEFYVRKPFRSMGFGLKLLSHAKEFGKSRGWSRLEVTTPPLPEFDKTMAFYVREGFSISGGRKLKVDL